MLRTLLKTALLITLILAIIIPAAWKLSKARTFQLFGGLVHSVETDKKIVALTFDDGPTQNTQSILDILEESGVKATFFITGAELEKNPAEGQKIVFAGHELGNHTYSHRRMVLKSQAFIKNEIETTDRLIRQAGYQGEINFRPPNAKKLVGLPYYLSKNNRRTIMWDIEPDSHPEISKSSEAIIENVNQEVQPGSIILLHVMYDSRKESAASIKGIVDSLRGKGYQFVTVSELLQEETKN